MENKQTPVENKPEQINEKVAEPVTEEILIKRIGELEEKITKLSNLVNYLLGVYLQ